MLWSRRRVLSRATALTVLAGAGAGLAGCGFRPVYGQREDGRATAALLHRVDIDSIPDRPGQKLRNLLIDRFYLSGEAPDKEEYQLRTALKILEQKTGLAKDDSATRAQLTVTADFELREIATDRVRYQATSVARVSFSLLVGSYATYSTRENALNRALIQIADDIKTRIALYFSRKDDEGAQ